MAGRTKGCCALVGVGHMGLPILTAIAPYFFENNWRVVAVDRDPVRRAAAAALGVEARATMEGRTDLLLLGVRPQQIGTLSETLDCDKHDLVMSMMAGVSCSTLQQLFPRSDILRCIPNTPCEFGDGITPVYLQPGTGVSNIVGHCFNALGRMGEVLLVESECQIDAATGISAGGPAYVMLFAEAMIQASIELGFTAEQARLLVAHTFQGSGAMLRRSAKSTEQLACEVMTPNGTTELGVACLRRNGVAEAIAAALRQAANRASQLAESAALASQRAEMAASKC